MLECAGETADGDRQTAPATSCSIRLQPQVILKLLCVFADNLVDLLSVSEEAEGGAVPY